MSEVSDIPELRLDKTKLKVVSISDKSAENEYWRNTTPKERLQHAERVRRIAYGRQSGSIRTCWI
ncbi:MAG: hypothetical protein IT174_00615 [Acidobacteria bacterium]|nr:hypothetical protein [Acidobacteriota bacterium]